ncbi:hypothetical protein EVAR_56555_1 [Eumeta japonica]|uniref:Uncharacterized protein n=1 Tax=Eumeta variegata TaxID=151549 RepID=A0A4C1ZSI1_EUMVA|nr:hypothetical protein EVAR_56555_1 [Eumeta japonica]
MNIVNFSPEGASAALRSIGQNDKQASLEFTLIGARRRDPVPRLTSGRAQPARPGPPPAGDRSARLPR